MSSKLSIIIPVLNEEKTLPNLLSDIKACQQKTDFGIECLVVDGGSEDCSVKICKEFDCQVILGPKGRGQQLSLGAKRSTGDSLWFLHADSRVVSQHCTNVIETLQANSIAAGAFNLKFDDRHPILRLAEAVNKIRFRITRIFYGDHGIFLKRHHYFASGGFPEQALFEDIEISKRLKKLGKLVLISPSMITSARRFKKNGVVRTYLKMALMHILYWLGVSPERLTTFYEKTNRCPIYDDNSF